MTEKKIVYRSEFIKIRFSKEVSIHVLRGRFKRVPTVEDIDDMVISIFDFISKTEERVAIFLGSKMDHGILSLEHLLCIAKHAIHHKSLIRHKVIGTKLLLNSEMTSTFQLLLDMFKRVYTPIRPFMITDNATDSQDFETMLLKEVVNG